MSTWDNLETVAGKAADAGRELEAGRIVLLADAIDAANEIAALEDERDALLARIAELEGEQEPPIPAKTFQFGCGGGNVDPGPLEARIGNKLGLRRIYHSAGKDPLGNVDRIKADLAAGRGGTEASWKIPASMASAATGGADEWLGLIADRLNVALGTSAYPVKVAFNHEPENDNPSASAVVQNAYRDDWCLMQNRAAAIFAEVCPQAEFGVILMGYHSLQAFKGQYYPRWSLANLQARLDLAKIDYLGLDIYDYGDRSAFTPAFKEVQTFARDHGIDWGLSETGLTGVTFALNRNWFPDMVTLVKEHGGSFIDYFNSNLNSPAVWEFTPGDAREVAFGSALAAIKAGTL